MKPMRRTVLVFCLGAAVGCSLSLGLNGDANRPCLNGKCLDTYVCFKEVCVPASGTKCTMSDDCPSAVCLDGGCGLPPCSDLIRNNRETDLDCGGFYCGKCALGLHCRVGTDCLTKVCGIPPGPDGGTDAGAGLDAGVCLLPSCTDSELNGTESDIDCGGDAGCARCLNGLGCFAGTDCASGSCVGVCQPASCADKVLNAPESDVDCGGPCQKCADGKICFVGTDCASQVCTTGTCTVPTCQDLKKNGRESDVDCGGSCQGCADTKVCAANTDCANAVCQNATCRPAHCANGTRDVDETDKDCGGPCQKCGLGKRCSGDADCASNNCFSGYCLP